LRAFHHLAPLTPERTRQGVLFSIRQLCVQSCSVLLNFSAAFVCQGTVSTTSLLQRAITTTPRTFGVDNPPEQLRLLA